ncbi:MAG TPA: hypothetical protein VFE03_01825, partial [Caulobacteraceae bacterium]|nr:hypothetical protein [Caulobacteraceae bacterium]
MSPEVRSAQDDLAFMRSLVEGGGSAGALAAIGEAYVAGGLLYGLQTLGHGLQGLGWLKLSDAGGMTLAIGPTVVFLGAMIWISRRHPRSERLGGMVGKAIGAAFGAIGLANLALISIFAWMAWRDRSLETWLIYPCVVFVLQGAAWMVAFMMRRKAWLGLVALGWFGAGVAMAFTIGSAAYVLIVAAA